MKAIIKVGYRCNQRCVFCHRLELREPTGGAELTDRAVRDRIARAKALGHTMVVLSGGEPTIRRELRGWASEVAALGMGLGLITNGQMLAYPELVDALIARRLRYVHMSLHGGSAAVHDPLTGAHGFAHTRSALDNLHGRGIELVVNAVVSRANLHHLSELVDLLRGYPEAVLKFSLIEPRGGGDRWFDELTPSVVAAGAAVVRAFEADPDRADRRGFAHEGLPLCVVPGWEPLHIDLETAGFATMIEVGEPDFFAVDERARVKPDEPCRDCTWRGSCPGLYRGYLSRRGATELVAAVGGRRSNSFHYARVGLLDLEGGEGCPLRRDGVTPWALERDLLVREGDAIARYRTATRDFASDEISSIKHRLGQIYLDRSTKPALDDFAADLAKLSRSPWCEGCPERPRCTGTFELTDDQPFFRDEAALRELIAGMEGGILDVGCGEGRYLDLLMPRAAAGTLCYLGIDPDPARLAKLGRRWPAAELYEMSAEAMAVLGRRFDHILLLRSWNHLTHVDQVLATIPALLREEGTLTVVDDVGFGLARTLEQASRGELSPAIFEHYRNHDSTAAHRRISAMAEGGLVLVTHREVTPATSSQWLLHYRRAGQPT